MVFRVADFRREQSRLPFAVPVMCGHAHSGRREQSRLPFRLHVLHSWWQIFVVNRAGISCHSVTRFALMVEDFRRRDSKLLPFYDTFRITDLRVCAYI